jgi:Cdc6-like AAA superfamily ATPase
MKHQTLTDHCRIQVRQIFCALLTHAHGSIAELQVLNSCRRAHGAACHHGDRNGCLKRTRESVLNKIESWAGDFDRPPIFWLNGLAGTGKSTIAQTIAERVFADGHLGGSFFCSRGFEDRSNLKLIFPTLAFQLAQKYPTFRSSLIHLLQSNPDAIHESLQDQMEKFLVKPLQSAAISTVLVIDALDECKDKDPESAILLVLGQLVSKIPRVKFFITSRPEAHVVAGFRGPLLQGLTNVFILHDIEPHTSTVTFITSSNTSYLCLHINEVVGTRIGQLMNSSTCCVKEQLAFLYMLLQQLNFSTTSSCIPQTG